MQTCALPIYPTAECRPLCLRRRQARKTRTAPSPAPCEEQWHADGRRDGGGGEGHRRWSPAACTASLMGSGGKSRQASHATDESRREFLSTDTNRGYF